MFTGIAVSSARMLLGEARMCICQYTRMSSAIWAFTQSASVSFIVFVLATFVAALVVAALLTRVMAVPRVIRFLMPLNRSTRWAFIIHIFDFTFGCCMLAGLLLIQLSYHVFFYSLSDRLVLSTIDLFGSFSLLLILPTMAIAWCLFALEGWRRLRAPRPDVPPT